MAVPSTYPASPVTVLRVAHRAGNHLAAIAPALALGADIIEADVQLRRDRLEVRHARSLGQLPYLWEPFYLVRDLRLQLSDLRAATPPGALLMLDLKGTDPSLGQRVRAAMAGAPEYVVCSRQWATLSPFYGDAQVRVVHSARKPGELQRLHQHLLSQPTWGVSLHVSLLSTATIERLRQRAGVVMSWPVDTPEAYDAVVGVGVNAVISNDLNALVTR